MKKNSFLTIGIASYNYSKYLESAFEAIKKQSFKDYEILYCDDGSTDNSVEIIKTIIENNPEINIRLVQGENLGVMGNKNRILENAQGKYLMLCDADDKMLPDCLELLCKKAVETDADQVVGAFQQSDDNSKIIQIQEIPSNLSRWIWGAHHATIYKMQVIKENNLRFNEKYYPDDMYFNMIFHDCSKNIATVNDVVYDWNMHSDSTSATKESDDDWHGYKMLKSSLKYIGEISKKYNKPEYYEIEYAAVKMYCLACLYRSRTKLKKFIQDYKRMHTIMKKTFPEYYKNNYVLKMDAKGIVRKPTAKIIHIFVLIEKIHFMPVFLFLYWILLKFKKVTV